MKLSIAILAMLTLISCKSQKFEGTLTVSSELKLGDIQLVNGEYETEFKVTGKRSIEVTVKDGNNSEEFEIKTKDKIEDLFKNGRVFIKADRSNLEFDIDGSYDAQSSMGQKQRDYEPCTYQEPHTVCYPTGRRGQVSCHTQWRTVNGYRDVEYSLKTTVTKLSLGLDSKDALPTYAALYEGKNTKRERIYEYEGMCR